MVRKLMKNWEDKAKPQPKNKAKSPCKVIVEDAGQGDVVKAMLPRRREVQERHQSSEGVVGNPGGVSPIMDGKPHKGPR